TSLIIPGVEMGGIVPVFIGLALGTIFLDRADAWVPHIHVLITGRIREEGDATDEDAAKADERVKTSRLGGLILFIVAITLHNMPEGLAVGVGFGTGNLGNALSLMIAI